MSAKLREMRTKEWTNVTSQAATALSEMNISLEFLVTLKIRSQLKLDEAETSYSECLFREGGERKETKAETKEERLDLKKIFSQIESFEKFFSLTIQKAHSQPRGGSH